MDKQIVLNPQMEHYSAMKKNGGLMRATSWINFENIVKGKSQTQRAL